MNQTFAIGANIDVEGGTCLCSMCDVFLLEMVEFDAFVLGALIPNLSVASLSLWHDRTAQHES